VVPMHFLYICPFQYIYVSFLCCLHEYTLYCLQRPSI
jgi:hypothetical protein